MVAQPYPWRPRVGSCVRSGRAKLNGLLSGNSGRYAGLNEAWPKVVFDDQEGMKAYPAYSQRGVQGAGVSNMRKWPRVCVLPRQGDCVDQ